MTNLKQHPLSAAWPAMLADEYQSLKDSIETIGVQNPITLFEGQVIDGWHRLKAAIEVGMPCPSKMLGDVDPVHFVSAQNHARRNVSASQRALAISAIYAWRPHGDQRSAVTADRKTTKQLAIVAKTGTRTMEQAKVVNAMAVIEVVEAVKSGAVTVETASAVAKLPKKEQKKIAAEGPEAMRKAAKPAPALVAVPAAVIEPEDTYTPLDAAQDQIEELQSMLAVANLGTVAPEDRDQAANLIGDLRAEVKTLRVNLKAVTQSRDGLMNELAMVKRQCISQQRRLKSLKAA